MAMGEVEELVKDAESLYQEALKDVEAGRVRKAAENAWAATVRATEALLISRKRDYESIKWPGPRRYELDRLSVEEKAVDVMRIPERYGSRETFLHGSCFYEGVCEPRSTERRIYETIDYIEDVKKIVYGKNE